MAKLKNYISDEDIFLKHFDHTHPSPSKSQKDEIAKHARISHLRDNAEDETNTSEIWADF